MWKAFVWSYQERACRIRSWIWHGWNQRPVCSTHPFLTSCEVLVSTTSHASAHGLVRFSNFSTGSSEALFFNWRASWYRLRMATINERVPPATRPCHPIAEWLQALLHRWFDLAQEFQSTVRCAEEHLWNQADRWLWVLDWHTSDQAVHRLKRWGMQARSRVREYPSIYWPTGRVLEGAQASQSTSPPIHCRGRIQEYYVLQARPRRNANSATPSDPVQDRVNVQLGTTAVATELDSLRCTRRIRPQSSLFVSEINHSIWILQCWDLHKLYHYQRNWKRSRGDRLITN